MCVPEAPAFPERPATNGQGVREAGLTVVDGKKVVERKQSLPDNSQFDVFAIDLLNGQIVYVQAGLLGPGWAKKDEQETEGKRVLHVLPLVQYYFSEGNLPVTVNGRVG